MKQTSAGPRRAQIEQGHELAGWNAAECSRRSADAHIDDGRHIADELELRREVGELERDTQRAFNDLLAGYQHPDQCCQRNREELETQMTEARIGHQATEPRARWRGRKTRRRRPTSSRSLLRSVSGEMPRSSLPSITRESVPDSSETTITTASFSSVSSSAA